MNLATFDNGCGGPSSNSLGEIELSRPRTLSRAALATTDPREIFARFKSSRSDPEKFDLLRALRLYGDELCRSFNVEAPALARGLVPYSNGYPTDSRRLAQFINNGRSYEAASMVCSTDQEWNRRLCVEARNAIFGLLPLPQAFELVEGLGTGHDPEAKYQASYLDGTEMDDRRFLALFASNRSHAATMIRRYCAPLLHRDAGGLTSEGYEYGPENYVNIEVLTYLADAIERGPADYHRENFPGWPLPKTLWKAQELPLLEQAAYEWLDTLPTLRYARRLEQAYSKRCTDFPISIPFPLTEEFETLRTLSQIEIAKEILTKIINDAAVNPKQSPSLLARLEDQGILDVSPAMPRAELERKIRLNFSDIHSHSLVLYLPDLAATLVEHGVFRDPPLARIKEAPVITRSLSAFGRAFAEILGEIQNEVRAEYPGGKSGTAPDPTDNDWNLSLRPGRPAALLCERWISVQIEKAHRTSDDRRHQLVRARYIEERAAWLARVRRMFSGCG